MSYTASSSETIPASRSVVWKALTDPADVKEYFFGTNLETTWEPGTPISFKGEWEGKSYEDKGEVISFNPEDSLSYTYWSPMSGTPDVPESYQTLTYTLADDGDGTKVTIDQSDVESQEKADHSAQNWSKVLEGLKTYLAGK